MALMAVTAAAGAAEAPAVSGSPPAPSAEAGKASELAEIQVTGTRIAGGGYNAPNPVLVVDAARVEGSRGHGYRRHAESAALVSRHADASDHGRRQPPTSIGQRIVDLRGLGAERTLVPGRRAPLRPEQFQGTVDLNNIPTNLVQRVEVVTGGASALYGADAVAGVVNFILDKDFVGFSADTSYGRAQAGDMNTEYLALKAGTRFADGRGHFLIGGEFLNNDGAGDCFSRSFCAQNVNILANPTPGVNGLPANLMYSNLFAVNSANGLIISGPLSGTTFSNNGAPTRFNYGDLAGFAFMHGGDSDNGRQLWLEGGLLSSKVQRDNLLAHTDYDFTDTTQGFLELSYARVTGKSAQIAPVEFPTTLSADNAYIPASLRPALAGETDFQFKRQNNDFGDLLPTSEDKNYRAAVGLKGLLGDWHWDGYYQYGRHTNDSRIDNNRINANWANAVDAVLAPNGQVVCRSTLTDPTNGCHPVNLFGVNQSDSNAVNYVNGTSTQTRVLVQNIVAANISGSPFSTWAGPVSLGTGAEYRRDTADGTVDAISAAQGWWNNTGAPIAGQQTVTEGYVEMDVPIAKSLVLNLADRETHYNTPPAAPTPGKSARYGTPPTRCVSGPRNRGTFARRTWTSCSLPPTAIRRS